MALFTTLQLATLGRAGVGRAGLERSGCLGFGSGAQYVNVSVEIANVDRTASVIIDSLTITHVLNDQPDTCRFTLEPGAVIADVGKGIRIGLGAIGNTIFAGQVMRMTHRRRVMPADARQAPFVDVECSDYTPLFDRRLITTTYTAASATDIALDLIRTYTAGFTTANVASGLPTIDYFTLTNEKPSAALRRLVNLMGGGGFYIDPVRDVHLFPATGETGPGAPTNPATLTNTLWSLKSFTHAYDFSQVRNRVVFEGQRTRTLTDVPAGTSTDLPVEEASNLRSSGGTLRVGTQILDYSSAQGVSANPPGSPVSTDTAAGSTTLPVVDQTQFPSAGWAKVGDQIIRYHSLGVSFLQDIPASGYGSLAQAMKADTPVAAVPVVYLSSTTIRSIATGDELVDRVTANDTGSQTTLSASEGGDGIHESVISDGRVNAVGGLARATQDLTLFAGATGLLTIAYDSEDMNQTVGAQQVVNFSTPDAVAATLTITQVDWTFPVPNHRPFRTLQANTVVLARFADLTQTETT